MFGSADIEAALASVPYLEAFGHIVIAWIWLDQLNAADVAERVVIARPRPPRQLTAIGALIMCPLRIGPITW